MTGFECSPKNRICQYPEKGTVFSVLNYVQWK
jgi:hypothetical protein